MVDSVSVRLSIVDIHRLLQILHDAENTTLYTAVLTGIQPAGKPLRLVTPVKAAKTAQPAVKHWTQRPENKRRLRKILRQAAKARNAKRSK